MEKEDDLLSAPGQPIYTSSHLVIATIFGGPLAIVYVIAENFRQLGYPQKIRNTWIFGIISFVLFIALVLLIASKMTANFLPSIISILFGLAVMQSWQGDDIRQHLDRGGPQYPLSRALLIGLLGFVCTFIFMVVLLVVLNLGFGMKFLHGMPGQ